MFENIIRKHISKIQNIKGILGTLGTQIVDLQKGLRPKGILESTKSIFAKKQNLLPATRL